MMPELSGDMLIEALRAQPELDPTPIVLLTAKADEELRVKLLGAGAQDYVNKPFSVEELRARAANLIKMKKGNERIGQLNQELRAANTELEAFTYSVSHDLRAPIRGIDAFSSILREEHYSCLSREGKELLDHVRTNIKWMTELVEGLLRLSHLSRKPLVKRRVVLAELVREVLNESREQHPNRRIEVQIADLPEVAGDPSLLRQVFFNLISNGFKFTRQKENAVIQVGCMQKEDERVFFVRDNGVGFDMNYADKLFGVFQRLHNQSEFEGTGIGLSIVQRIIQRHGGRIWAEAEIDKGATFYFTLPE
jgi:light-regulated signal transduction histidine kinase (bacteriophytochrome)